jgi:hypothetical protein
MELDEKTLKGHWSTDNNRGIDFFIINDAIFSKLCILGEDVEPCFEGASVSAPQVSSHFSMDNEFTATLSSMIKELKELTFALQNKGGNSMDGMENTTPVVEEQAIEVPAAEEVATENFSAEEDKVSSETIVENQNTVEEFEKKEEPEEEKKEESEEKEKEEDDEEEKEPKKNHSLEDEFALVKEELDELKNQYSLLQKENEELIKFKNSVEDEKKDALINSFYMLSDEDKKEVIENKSKYSLDDIEAKLSVICVRKRVNFNNEEVKTEEQPALIYNFNAVEEVDALPAWLKAVEAKRNNNN